MSHLASAVFAGVVLFLEVVDKPTHCLYNYLSNKGAHVLGSTRAQFHVSRTTVVEWTMMFAGRVQAFLATPHGAWQPPVNSAPPA